MMKRMVTILVLLCMVIAYPQNSASKKLKDLKGKVKKITVTTDKGEVTFEGKEAENLLKKMKKSNPIVVKVETDIDEEFGEVEGDEDAKVFIYKSHPGFMDRFMRLHKNMCMPDIKCFNNDSVMNRLEMSWDDCCKDDSNRQKSCKKMMFNFNGGSHPMHMMKEFNINIDDDEKDSSGNKMKKIVIMKRDGDKTEVETYTGEEAEKKIKELGDESVTISEDGKKVEKKIIIKKKDVLKDEKSTAPSDKEGKKERNE